MLRQAMDKKTGYHTETILCMPVKDHLGEMIAVYQATATKSE